MFFCRFSQRLEGFGKIALALLLGSYVPMAKFLGAVYNPAYTRLAK
jgi:hypothetical protein